MSSIARARCPDCGSEDISKWFGQAYLAICLGCGRKFKSLKDVRKHKGTNKIKRRANQSEHAVARKTGMKRVAFSGGDIEKGDLIDDTWLFDLKTTGLPVYRVNGRVWDKVRRDAEKMRRCPGLLIRFMPKGTLIAVVAAEDAEKHVDLQGTPLFGYKYRRTVPVTSDHRCVRVASDIGDFLLMPRIMLRGEDAED